MLNPYAKFLGTRDAQQVIAETSARIEAILHQLGAAGIEKSPAPGKWSAREIVCHLADSEIAFGFRLRQTLAEDNHTMQPWDQEKWAVAYAGYDAALALTTFTALRNWTLALIKSIDASALTRTATHPERGTMTFQTIIETMGGHDLNHLQHLDAIAARLSSRLSHVAANTISNQQSRNSIRLIYAVNTAYLALRYYAAYLMMTYGFAKLMGAQFTVIDAQLDSPMSQVSPFWLTWYFFGLSPIYGSIIALAQIGGGILIVFRRTALLGACLLAPVIINILLIDTLLLQWEVLSGPVLNAWIVLAAVITIFTVNWRIVLAIIWPVRPAASRWQKLWIVTQVVSIVLLLAFTAKEAYWTANTNNRAPTPIDGAWIIDSVQGNVPDALKLATIYFEYNRAFMCIFRDRTGNLEAHDFRVIPEQNTLQITKTWLERGDEIFNGKYKRQGDTLILSGNYEKSPVVILLKRKPMPIKDHS